MYLRLKSFQRFTETWALLERCAAAGREKMMNFVYQKEEFCIKNEEFCI